METESPSPEDVKGSLLEIESGITEKRARIFSGGEDRRTFSFYLRVEGLLNGVFITKGRGRTRYFDFSHEYFHQKTGRQGGRQIPMRTIERNMPRYWRWTDCYRAEKTRVGSRWVMRVTPIDSVQLAIPGAFIRDRLIAAILSHLAKAGRSHINREFLRRFSEIAGLPLMAVEAVLYRDRKFVGELRRALDERTPVAPAGEPSRVACKFRGVGTKKKLLVTDAARWAAVQAENEARLAALYRGESPLTTDENSAGAGEKKAVGTAKLHPRSAFLRNERLKNSGPSPAGSENRAQAPPARVTTGYRPSDHDPPNRDEDVDSTPGVREPSSRPPLQICARFVRPAKLEKCARWLAGSRLQAAHVKRDRVRFLFPHAANFALKALRFGYPADAIAVAYAAGVERSHQDSLDGDFVHPSRIDALTGEKHVPARPPSATVVYAWLALRGADARSTEELWAAFFAAPWRPRDSAAERKSIAAAVAIVRAREKPKPTSPPPVARTEGDRTVEKLRAKIEGMQNAQRAANADLAVTAADVIAYLETIGMNIAELGRFTYEARRTFFKRAAKWKREQTKI